MKTVWIILISFVVTAAIVGGGTYYFVNAQATKDKDNLQAQITDLNKKYDDSRQALTATQSAIASTTASVTADWKTYTNTVYSYSLKYPTDWQLDSSNAEKSFTPRGTENNSVGGDLIVRNHIARNSIGDVQATDRDIFVMIYKSTDTLTQFANNNQKYQYKVDGNISGQKDLTLGTKSALQLISTNTDSPVGVQGIFTFVKLQSDEIMVIKYSGQQSGQLPDRTVLDDIIGSLKFSK